MYSFPCVLLKGANSLIGGKKIDKNSLLYRDRITGFAYFSKEHWMPDKPAPLPLSAVKKGSL